VGEYGVFPMPGLSKSWKDLTFSSKSDAWQAHQLGQWLAFCLRWATTAQKLARKSGSRITLGVCAVSPEGAHAVLTTRFLDRGNVNQIVRHYGYYNGDYATEIFHDWIQQKLGSPDATFGDLIEANGLDLRVYATNLNTRQVFEFSYRKTKDVSFANAVRASICVPLFFTATEIKGQIFVDGGTVFDFPLMGFGKSEIDNTLGLAFARSSVVATEDQEDGEFGFRQPLQYIKRLVTVIQRVQSPVFALHEELQQNTILIDTAGVSSLNFKLTQEEKERLIANGCQAVWEHFHGIDHG